MARSIEGYKKGEPDVGWWLTQIKLGEEWRRKSLFEDKWPLWRKYYRGVWRNGILPNNIFFKMLRTVVPRIYFRNPSISITNRKPGIENYILSALMERTHNKLIRQMQLKKSMKSQVQSAFMFGGGIGKLGFGAEFTPTPENLGITEAPLVGKNASVRVEYSNYVESNFPWYKWAPTGTYILPWGTVDKNDARWEAFFFERPLEDVKSDSRMRPIAKDLKASPAKMFDGKRVNTISKEKEIPIVQLYEVRDKKTGKVFIISPHLTDRALFYDDDEFTRLRIDNGYLLTFNEDDESAWGVPDSQILEPIQLEANETRTLEMYHRRLSIVKVLARRGAIKPEEAQKMISPDVNPLVWIDAGHLSDALQLMTGSTIPRELLEMDQIIQNDVRESIGFSRNEFGEFRQGSRAPSAREVEVVRAASAIRVEERRDMVADLLVDLVQGMTPIIFDHWNEEQVFEMVGPGGIPIWVAFRPQMMDRRMFEVNVDPDTAIPQTKDVREQKAIQLYATLKDDPMIDPIRLRRYLLHELHGVAFDDMMMGLPIGAGLSPENPLEPRQFGALLQNTAQRFPQLAIPNLNRAAARTGGPEVPEE